MFCAGFYEGRLRELIHHYKFDPMEGLAKPLGAFLRASLPRDLAIDKIVPVPLHKRRLAERGFNQAELLARQVAPLLSAPVEPLLERIRETAPQSSLRGIARRRNLRGAVAVKPAASVRNQRILLVDDVLTTGVTVNSCALALKQAGASFVAVLALARADRRFASMPDSAFVQSQSVGGASR